MCAWRLWVRGACADGLCALSCFALPASHVPDPLVSLCAWRTAVEAEAGAAAGTQHAGRKHGREPLAYGPARDRVVASEVRELRGQVQVLKQALARERMAQLKGKEAAGKDKARMLQRLAGEMEELLRLEV